MYCYYCHNKTNFNQCKCYLIDMGDGLTCTQCNRAQINQIYTSPYEKNDKLSSKILKNFELISEYCQKLNLDEIVIIPITNFYNLILDKIGPSSYNRKYILLYAIYTISIKYDIYISVSRLCKIAACPLKFFHKTINFLKKKNIFYALQPFEKQCISLLYQMGIFNKIHQNKIISVVKKIIKISDNKIPTILAASFCYFQEAQNPTKKSWRKFVSIASSATHLHHITIIKCFKKYFEKNIK